MGRTILRNTSCCTIRRSTKGCTSCCSAMDYIPMNSNMGCSVCSSTMMLRDCKARSSIRDILRMQIADLQEKLAENGVSISFTQEFEDYMSTKGYEPAYGARPIKRLMQKELVNLLAKNILEGRVSRNAEIVVDINDGQIAVREK